MSALSSGEVQDEQRLRTGFSIRTALALAFADVSPIVALYTVFSLGIVAAGPAFWWAFPIVLGGQLLVACTFGELASRWPYAGSVYQWARHVTGRRAGWFTAWAYMWGLTIALSALSFTASGYLLNAVGVQNPSHGLVTATAFGVLVVGTLANIVGRTVLKLLVVVSLVCELVASIGLGAVLLLFYRVNPVSVLFQGPPDLSGGMLLGAGPLLVAVAFVGWSFVGFESAGSIAEELEDPARDVPKALILSLVSVALVVMFAGAALILSIPDLDAVLAGRVADPVTTTLQAHFGNVIGRPLLVVFVIGYLASFLAVQAAVSRTIWASARDRALPASRVLGRLAGRERLPVYAIASTGLGAAVFVFLTGSQLYSILVNFTTIGFYIAFGIPVWGAAVAHLRGSWQPGRFSLGRFSAPVTYAASFWLLLQTVNIAWPRQTENPWYVDWSMVLTLAVVTVVGVVVYRMQRRHILPEFGRRREFVDN